ncbi:MAG: lipid-A-disaccharide synthase [Prevotella sp.]|jgi:lipid-A-disaccharide synthase|nr:lipid-A-disaccharide synthase [Prevotella sp.]
MKYYLIAGEASGDLHASHLMQALKRRDEEAEFRFFGGDLMSAVGGTRVKHYRELAYMGFVPVLLHLRTILRNMRMCKQDISQWRPDVVILVDYPGFNLDIAKYVHQLNLKSQTSNLKSQTSNLKVYYYISPKIWAWKEYRIKNIKRDVDELFSILPFEVPFFEEKHHYRIHYVGNPTAQEVREFLQMRNEKGEMSNARPVIALLAGSRKQEIKDNLPAMIEATRHLVDRYDIVVAGAPSIELEYYGPFLKDSAVSLVSDETYPLLAKATAALVTSGTATLETCMFRVPQVVCYKTPMARLIGFLKRHVLKVRYVSLVNLIADREVVRELVAETFSVENIRRELEAILPGGDKREQMLRDYDDVHQRLGESHAPDEAARIMIELLRQK